MNSEKRPEFRGQAMILSSVPGREWPVQSLEDGNEWHVWATVRML